MSHEDISQAFRKEFKWIPSTKIDQIACVSSPLGRLSSKLSSKRKTAERDLPRNGERKANIEGSSASFQLAQRALRKLVSTE
jgi:hypothetical protein